MSDIRVLSVPRTQSIQRWKLHGHRSLIVERSTTWTSTARPNISCFQANWKRTCLDFVTVETATQWLFVFHALYKYSICYELYAIVRRPFVNICLSGKLLPLPDKWLDHDQTQSFANIPFPFSIPFSSAPQSPNGRESCHSSHCEAVCQTVCYRPTVGLRFTFCLPVCTL